MTKKIKSEVHASWYSTGTWRWYDDALEIKCPICGYRDFAIPGTARPDLAKCSGCGAIMDGKMFKETHRQEYIPDRPVRKRPKPSEQSDPESAHFEPVQLSFFDVKEETA